MKPLLFCILAILCACHEEDSSPSLSLQGQWAWKSTCGGIVGCAYSSDTQRELLTIDDAEFTILQNGHVTLQSKYTVKTVSSPTDDSRVYEIQLDDGLDYRIEVRNKSLTLDYHSFIFSIYQRK